MPVYDGKKPVCARCYRPKDESLVPGIGGGCQACIDECNSEMGGQCLQAVADTLQGVGCSHGPDSHKATPAMMYPEWIKCVGHSIWGRAIKAAANVAVECRVDLLEVIPPDISEIAMAENVRSQIATAIRALKPEEGE